MRIFALLPLLALASGCKLVVLDPAGDVAAQQGMLVVVSTVLMLLIILPVMALTVLFAWRYRHTNKDATYDPDWHHSTHLELVIWAAPLLIIICLGALTWMGTHLLDPYRPLDRVTAAQPVDQDAKSLEVQVVALDWKWLFIYPEFGIATVNEMAAPVDRPIDFRITASSVMNSFYIPALAGQIYAMPGMQTKLHAVINAEGRFPGFSANYSGAGFSHMRFTFHGLSHEKFDEWVAGVKQAGGELSRDAYLALEKPSENEPVRRYAAVEVGLFDAIRNLCVEPGKMCMHEMMSIDAKGGLGLAGIRNVLPLEYDKQARRGAVFAPGPGFVTAVCTVEESRAVQAAMNETVAKIDRAPLVGHGLPRPGTKPSSISSAAGERRPPNS